LIRVLNFAVHAHQLLAHTPIAWGCDEIEVGSQRFQRAKRLAQLMNKFSHQIFRPRICHSQPPKAKLWGGRIQDISWFREKFRIFPSSGKEFRIFPGSGKRL